MSCPRLRPIAFLIGMMALSTTRAQAEVRIVRPEADNQHRMAIVSDGPMPWTLRYYGFVGRAGPWVESKLVPVSPDRMLFIHGLVLHLIDTRNGVVLNRWIFADQIRDVRVEGDKFHVKTIPNPDTKGDERTITITTDSPPPPRWIDGAGLHRGAVFEGSWFDKAAGLEPEYKGPASDPALRKPLAAKDAERLIVEIEDAARRDPFSPQFGVCLALLMRDLGRADAEATFLRAIERATNSYGELFAIANNLENGGEADWSALAFNQAYQLLWQQGADPRWIYGMLPRLILLYQPHDLRLEIPDERRAKLLDRLYLLAPYVEQSPWAWRRLAAYFDERGDSQNAALWRERAGVAEAKSPFVWELSFYVERATRVLLALFLCVFVYYVILQRRYAPQRRLLRSGKSWWRGLLRLSPVSMTCWDRQDRQILYGLLALSWLTAGLWGGLGQGASRGVGWPVAGASGTLRAPATEKFLRDLPPTRDKDLLIALSLQQAEKDIEAEALYLELPDSVVKWNNLGVLYSKNGRTDKATESFEYALRADSQSVEPAFNLNRPVSDPWTERHSKYLPGKKMTSLPAHDVVYRALRGSLWHLAGQSLRGPTLAVPTYRKAVDWMFSFSGRGSGSIPAGILYLFLFGPLVFAAVALAVPYCEVTQPPGRWHWLIEFFFPGTAREWGRIGGLLLTVTIWGGLEYVSGNSRWTPFEIGINYRIAFGFPPSVRGIVGAADPGWFWNHGIVSLAVIVFVVNAIVVLRARERLIRPTT